MQPIKDYIGQELHWISSKLPDRKYELRAGDAILARVQNQGRVALLIDTANGSWIFERRGMRRIITIQQQETRQEPVTIKQGINGNAQLLFPDGREYKWQGTSFWRDTWVLLNPEGAPLLHLKKSSLAQLEPVAASEPDLALLTTLCWYLRRLKKQSDEEIAAVSVIPSI
jgi:hypothetical protein